MFKNVFKYVIASAIILIFATGSLAQNTKTSASSPVDKTINSLSRVLVNGQMVVFNTGTSVLAIGDAVELDTSWTWLLNAQTSASLNLAMMLPDSFTRSINDSIQNGWWQLVFEYADTTGIGGDADTIIVVGTIFDSDSAGNTFTGFVDTVVMTQSDSIILSDYHWLRIDSIDGFLFDNGAALNVKASLLRAVVLSTNLLRAVGTLTDSLFADSSGAMAVFGSGLGWANIDGLTGPHIRPGARLEPTSGSDWIRSAFVDSAVTGVGRAHVMGLPVSLEQVTRNNTTWRRVIIR